MPGSDVALFIGIQKALIEKGKIQTQYLQAYTENWETVIASAKATSWEEITQTCQVAKTDIELAAEAIANSKAVVFA